ncbi:MAG: hypothetical protein J6035_01040 [Bacteroidaceae bacterium]|nr:hypothetical protein [Bacteroidaceae bacterium]
MKKNLLFGRLCATLAIAACALSVNAQSLKLESNSGFGLVPATMTANGKARITAVADDGLHIYNTNFIQEKVVSDERGEYVSGYRSETAEVSVTGAKVSKFAVQDFRAQINGEEVSASTLEEARDKVANLYEEMGDDDAVEIFNIEGHSFIYAYSNYEWSYSNSFFMYDLFGKQYPGGSTYGGGSLYVLGDDGYLHYATISYDPVYDASGAVWTVKENNVYTNSEKVTKDIRYKNADTGAAGEDLEICFTQTLFNSDDKWEYIVEKRDGGTLEYASGYSVEQTGLPGGKVLLRRSVQVTTPVTGLKIYSDDGAVVATISADYVSTPESYAAYMSVRGIWRIDGKHYLEVEKDIYNVTGNAKYIYALYLLGEGTSGARMVLEYEAEAEQDNTIYDLSGRRLSEKPASGYYIQGGKTYLAK